MQDDSSIYRSFTIVAVTQEAGDAKTFELAPADNKEVSYEAGQFITLVFKKGDREDRRSYSFSSAPVLKEPIRITIKRITNGEYSRKLLNYLKPGDTLNTSGISGFFRLPRILDQFAQIVFLAAGSGITPVYSLLKTALFTTDKNILLIYSSYKPEETIFYSELIELEKKFAGRLKVVFLFSQSDNVRRRLSKFLLQTLLEEHTIRIRHSLFYLCGPVSYMLVASISLITAGVPEEHIRKENFNSRPHSFKPTPPDTDAHMVTVIINKKSHSFPVRFPDTILTAARKLQLRLPYSCEAGNCGSCAATCTKGQTWMAYNEVLTDEEISKGKTLTCQAYPVGGDVEIVF